MGAPSTGVTALRGKTVPMPGTTVSKLQSNAMPRNYLCGAQSSPFRKFTDTPEGVGHRHKLPKLVEESNILIFAISETHRPSRSQQSCVIVTQTTEFGRD